MSEKNSVVRSLHDVGLASWFGGSLMGAVGLNGAAAQASQPRERLELSSKGWARWAPVNAAAIGLHLIGGAGLLATNKARVASQPGARANTAIKTGLTALALGLTAYSGAQGRKVAEHAHEGAPGATEPSAHNSAELKKAQQRLRGAQWAIPAVTGALVVLGAQQGEQQRPQSLVKNQLARVRG
jgi:hypothetical protein